MKQPRPAGRLRPQGPRRRRNQPVSRRATVLGLLALVVLTAGFAQLAVLSYNVIRKIPGSDEPQISTLKRVQFVGREQTVFDWSEQACEPRDIPDFPARAFRDATGQVQMIAAHYVTRRSVGPSLGRVKHQCEVVFGSDFKADPALFDDREWLGSPYTTDGKTVHALVHNEYQGYTHPGECATKLTLDCWYNSITLSRSTDGGRSYRHARPPPRHLVASIPYRYKPDSGFIGMFEPSNIVRNRRDGYYYAMASTQRYRQQRVGTCVFRTRHLGRPSSWRAWDGKEFSIRFVDPYVARVSAANHVCAPVSTPQIAAMSMSLTYNTYFQKYMLVSPAGVAAAGSGRPIAGFFYSLSDDLIHWEPRKVLWETVLHTTYVCGDRNPVYYPSILDPSSSSRNFETAGRTPYLYFTRFNYSHCEQTLNRDLVRVRLRFSK